MKQWEYKTIDAQMFGNIALDESSAETKTLLDMLLNAQLRVDERGRGKGQTLRV